MKQTRSLSEFSRLSEFTRLYPYSFKTSMDETLSEVMLHLMCQNINRVKGTIN